MKVTLGVGIYKNTTLKKRTGPFIFMRQIKRKEAFVKTGKLVNLGGSVVFCQYTFFGLG